MRRVAKLWRRLGDDAGSALSWAVVGLPGLLAMATLATDVGNLFRARAMLQATADAAALAAAAELPDTAAAEATALEFADKNLAGAIHGQVMNANTIEFGNWDNDNRVFTPLPFNSPDLRLDAVRAVARYSERAGNAVDSLFGWTVGFLGSGASAESIAEIASEITCLEQGFVARGRVYSGSQNQYLDGFCMHGEEGVKGGSQNFMECVDGVKISMPDPRPAPFGQLEFGSDNEGLECSLQQAAIDAPLPPRVTCGQPNSIIDNFALGIDLPPYLEGAPIIELFSKPTEAQFDSIINNSGNVVVVHDTVDIPSDRVLSNFGLIADDSVIMGSNTAIQGDVLLASCGRVDFGSNISTGSSDFCDTAAPTINIHIYAGENVIGGSVLEMNGTQIVGAPDYENHIVDMGSNLTSYRGVSIQSGGDLFVGSQLEFHACSPNGIFGHMFHAAVKTVRLVD